MTDETDDALDATLHPHLRSAVLLAQWMERARKAEAELDALRTALDDPERLLQLVTNAAIGWHEAAARAERAEAAVGDWETRFFATVATLERVQAERDALQADRRYLWALADDWARCTWGPYENPARALRAALAAYDEVAKPLRAALVEQPAPTCTADTGLCRQESNIGEICRETPRMVNPWVHGPFGHAYDGACGGRVVCAVCGETLRNGLHPASMPNTVEANRGWHAYAPGERCAEHREAT